MYLVEVIPIISIKTLGKLSYFTSLNVSLGDIVEISINKRKLMAIVVYIGRYLYYIPERYIQTSEITKLTKGFNRYYWYDFD